MPKVNGKSFPYTPAGKKAAKAAGGASKVGRSKAKQGTTGHKGKKDKY